MFLRLKVSILPSLLILFTNCSAISGVPIPGPNDAFGQVQLLDYLLALKNNYRLLVAEPFENHRPWAAHAASTQLSTVKYIFRTPEGRAFERERAVISGYDKTRFEQSLFIHASFDIPGTQNFFIKPKEKIKLRGQLFRMSIWVHSNMYLHSLVIIFRNAENKKVPVKAGRLMWHGWRRIDLQLPQSLFRRGKKATRRYLHELKGIKIVSHPLAEPGTVALMFDNLLIVSNVGEFQYNGFEITDSW